MKLDSSRYGLYPPSIFMMSVVATFGGITVIFFKP